MCAAMHGLTNLMLKDRLSRLTYPRACALLGPEGPKFIRAGGKWEIDLDQNVKLTDDRFTLSLDGAVVTITMDPAAKDKLAWRCSSCHGACEHVGAAFSIVLEEKMALGLAAPPPERVPIESLGEEELVRQALGRATGAGPNREDARSIGRSQAALDRLYCDQRRFGQDLPRGPSRLEGGRVLLHVPRFPHEHAGRLQAHTARPGKGGPTVLGPGAQTAFRASRHRRLL